MHQYSGVVIEAQPDWLTVSAHGESRAKNLLDLGVSLAKEEEARGGKTRKWRSMGYEGAHVGRVEYGQRDTFATELRLSGDAASEWMDWAVALADTITRLDLAVTWRGDPPVPRLGLRQLALAKRHHELKPASAAPWIVSDAEGDFTLYLGQRGSENFFRLYNKEAQSRKQDGAKYDGHYDGCWRWELETKAGVPMLLVKKLQKVADRAAWCQDYLHAYCVGHGLEPPFESVGGQKLVRGFRRKSDEDSKLQHLQKNVRPTIQWLAERGRLTDLRDALGLGQYLTAMAIPSHAMASDGPTMDGCGEGNAAEEGET